MKNENSKPRSYSEEFKAQAVELSNEIGTNKASKKLGVAYQTLQRWVGDADVSTSADSEPNVKDLEKEIKRLKKELGYHKKINDILKKSTAILSKDLVGDID